MSSLQPCVMLTAFFAATLLLIWACLLFTKLKVSKLSPGICCLIHGCCWEACYIFACCGLLGNIHVSARISVFAPFPMSTKNCYQQRFRASRWRRWLPRPSRRSPLPPCRRRPNVPGSVQTEMHYLRSFQLEAFKVSQAQTESSFGGPRF